MRPGATRDHVRSYGTGTAGLRPSPISGHLYGRLLATFHQACEGTEFTVADALLRTLEFMATRPRVEDGSGCHSLQELVAAHERLWKLRHPDPV